jgi:hypothetical protein
MSQFQQEFVTTAIEHYGLELEAERVDAVVLRWFQTYDPAWVVKALVEALYRGRYKVKSVDNILKDWQRLGTPLYKFTPDYEREILHSLRPNADSPVILVPSDMPAPINIPASELPVITEPLPDREQLDPEETAPFQHHDRSRLEVQLANEEIANLSIEPKLSVMNYAAIDRHLSPITSVLDPAPIERERVTPPAKLHLFNKLRSIVEPSIRPKESIQHSV